MYTDSLYLFTPHLLARAKLAVCLSIRVINMARSNFFKAFIFFPCFILKYIFVTYVWHHLLRHAYYCHFLIKPLYVIAIFWFDI